jgi:predicted ATP-grasp superfamily ATP-dependent carboligase
MIGFDESVYWCAYFAGYEVVVLGKPRNRVVIESDRLFSKYHEVDIDSFAKADESLVDIINGIVAAEGIQYVSPSGQGSTIFLGRYGKRISAQVKVVPVPDHELFFLLDNKCTCFDFCTAHGIPHARSLRLQTVPEHDAIACDFAYPVVVKEADAAGGRGVYYAADFSSLLELLRNKGLQYPLLLQEFVEGEDVAFNGFCLNGKIVACNMQHFTRVPLATGTVRVDVFVDNGKVRQVAEQLIAAVNYSGPINIDTRVSAPDGMPYIVDVNPRFWGGTQRSLVDGLNYLSVALGLSAEQPISRTGVNRYWVVECKLCAKSALKGDRRALKLLLGLHSVQLRQQLHLLWNRIRRLVG